MTGLALASGFLLVSCGIFGSDDNGIQCNPDLICTNDVSGEWTFLGLGDETITAIAVNPCNAGHILAGSLWNFSAGRQGKIFRSTDCGETWEQVWEGGRITQIVFDPKNPRIVYANPFGMIRSMDGGKTWSEINNGLAGHLDPVTSVIAVAVDPDNSERIYAGTGGTGLGWLFYSDNRGNEWKPVPGFDEIDEKDPDEYNNLLLANNVISLAINPLNTDELWAGTARRSHLLRSSDKGYTWQRIDLMDVGIGIDIIAYNTYSKQLYVMLQRYGIHKTSIDNINWHEIPMPDSLKIEPVDLEIIYTDSTSPILTTGLGVFKFSDKEWLSKNEGLPHVYARSSTSIENRKVYIGLADRNVIKEGQTQRIGGIYVRQF
jgi:hypothetical protein